MQENSIWVELGLVLKNLPRYIGAWTIGLLIAVLNDFAITAFALTGVLTGLATNDVTLGFLGFLTLYSLFRIVSNHAEAVHAGFRTVRINVPPPSPPGIISADNPYPPGSLGIDE
jgi:hypothetical protein